MTKNPHAVALGIAVAIVAASGAGFTYETHQLFKKLDGLVDGVATTNTQLRNTLAETQNSIALIREHVDRDLTVVGVAASRVEKASRAQEQYWSNYGMEVSNAINATTGLISHTDESLNRNLLPAATASLTETKTTIDETNATIRDTNAELKPVLAGLAETTAKASQLLSDPAIVDALKHLDASTLHVDGTTESIERSTLMIETKVQQLTKPPTLAARVGGYLLTAVSSAGNLIRFLIP